MRTVYFDRFEISLPADCVVDCSHSGNCGNDVREWVSKVVIDAYPDDIRAELKEYGAWNEEELADEEANRRRILWIAACNIKEETPDIEKQLEELTPRWEELVKALMADIDDDYRANEEDTEPSMCLTIGFTPADYEREDYSWRYQTGDNSYSGGAYLHANWGVVSLYRDSDPAEVAADIADQIGDSLSW